MKKVINNLFKKCKEYFLKNQLGFFIGGSLLLAVILVGVSLWSYDEFGAYQLDLSRPSLQAAREQAKKERKEAEEQAKKEKKASEFASEGKISVEVLEEFEKLYSQSLNKIDAEFFASTDISDKSLNLIIEQGE